jgi:hypothetical protein
MTTQKYLSQNLQNLVLAISYYFLNYIMFIIVRNLRNYSLYLNLSSCFISNEK